MTNQIQQTANLYTLEEAERQLAAAEAEDERYTFELVQCYAIVVHDSSAAAPLGCL